jgi:hypothetical protein
MYDPITLESIRWIVEVTAGRNRMDPRIIQRQDGPEKREKLRETSASPIGNKSAEDCL